MTFILVWCHVTFKLTPLWCSTFDKWILPLTRSRQAIPYGANLLSLSILLVLYWTKRAGRVQNTEGGDTDSEDEADRLEEVESYLRVYDPDFKVSVALQVLQLIWSDLSVFLSVCVSDSLSVFLYVCVCLSLSLSVSVSVNIVDHSRNATAAFQQISSYY